MKSCQTILFCFLLCGLVCNQTTQTAFAFQKAADKKEAKETSKDKDPVDEILAGHSYHGEAFNEGPRQKAYLIGGTGNVKFEVTTTSDEAQAFINQGIGQLHGFWSLEAERSFRQAIMLDRECAMAYWGAALANERNLKRARGFIKEAVERKDKVSAREKLYIEALERFVKEKPDSKKRAAQYLKDLESIVMAYPDDLEAKAFVCHRIWENGRAGIPVASYLATDALLKQIYEVEPLHPAHHYTIHLWDYRKPANAVAAAARCGPSAPSIAHMWHMPGHIYSRLKRYEDAVYQQEASARVDHGYMIRDRVMPDEIGNFAHNNEWLIRNLVFIGAADRAVDLAKNMVSLPRHPKYNSLKLRRGSYSYGRRRLLQALREFQLYSQAIGYCQSAVLESPDNDVEQVKTLRLLGCSAAALEQEKTVEFAIRELERLEKENQKLQKELPQKIDDLEASMNKDKDRPPYPRTKLVKSKTLKKDLEAAKKKQSEAKSVVRAVGKAKLAIEGYQAMAQNGYKAASDKLKKASGEDLSLVAELKYMAGEKEAALKDMRKQVERRPKETIPLARLIYLLSMEDTDEARKEMAEKFDLLRDASSSMDLSVDLFARLSPVAKSLGYIESNWQKEKGVAADIGFRPQLDSLGPFRWSPSLGPEWELPKLDGSVVSSNDFHGRAHILIFYLGHGCLHCAEQLQAFGPQVAEFEKLGIDMIAVSSDEQEGLRLAVENYEGEMPYRWHIADESREVFKRFRAYDDFENQPLHGTFLIDSRGRVRWQDIGYEPFMDHKFLLKEAARLLDQDASAQLETAVSGK